MNVGKFFAHSMLRNSKRAADSHMISVELDGIGEGTPMFGRNCKQKN